MLRFFATHGEPHSPSSQLWVPPRAAIPLANEKFGGIFKPQPAPSFVLARRRRSCPRGPGVILAVILDHFLATLALDIRNIGRMGLAPNPLGESVRRLCVMTL